MSQTASQTANDEARARVLPALLAQVPRHGWTEKALAAALTATGVAADEGKKLFPHGAADAVALFQREINDRMAEKIAARRDFDEMRTRDKVAFAVRARLEAMSPYREATSRLLSHSLMPAHLKDGATYLWDSADRIWTAAGDTSTDYNHTTKRLMLMGVMKATLHVWLRDKTPDKTETWKFLERRIEDTVAMGKKLAAAKSLSPAALLARLRGRAG